MNSARGATVSTAGRNQGGPLSTRTETNRLVNRGVRPNTPAPKSGKKGGGLSWKVDLDRPILLLKPGRATVAVDDIFTLKVQVSNPRKLKYDRLIVALSYDRHALEALELDDSPLSGALDPFAPPVKDLAQAGRITFAAQFAEPVDWSRRDVLAIRFRALNSLPLAKVEFLNGEGETALLEGDNIVLGESKGGFDRGTLGATVTVRSQGAAGAAGIFGASFANEVRSLTRQGRSASSFVTMGLSAKKKSVSVGEVFDVQLLLDNPDHLPLELIRVALRFDPKLLRVIDTDSDNVIHQGININDGSYRVKFPFDSHLRNSADNARGKIDYSVATGNPQLLATRGRLATIRFQALTASDFVPVWFDLDANGAIVSEALAQGANALVRPGDLRSSVRGLIMRVQPLSRKTPASRLEE